MQRKLQHDNIVKAIDSWSDANRYYILLEKCDIVCLLFNLLFFFSQSQFICRRYTMKSKQVFCRNAPLRTISSSQHFMYANFLKPDLTDFHFEFYNFPKIREVFGCALL